MKKKQKIKFKKFKLNEDIVIKPFSNNLNLPKHYWKRTKNYLCNEKTNCPICDMIEEQTLKIIEKKIKNNIRIHPSYLCQ